MLRLENNNLKGTVPFVKCEGFEVLSADCSEPRSIICPCCTRCFGLFTVNEDVLPCPSSTLQVKPFEGTKRLELYVTNQNGQLVTEFLSAGRGIDVIAKCISPTDCLNIDLHGDPIAVFVDGNALFDKIMDGNILSFGYSSNRTMQPNTCDDYVICNRVLSPRTPQRTLFNRITRFSGVVSSIFPVCSTISHC